jgi:hypothetical protein
MAGKQANQLVVELTGTQHRHVRLVGQQRPAVQVGADGSGLSENDRERSQVLVAHLTTRDDDRIDRAGE